MSASLEKMLALIQENDMCVLATVSGGQPHVSLMAYMASEDGCRLYLLTSTETKKFRNLSQNPKVSLMIDDRTGQDSPEEVRALSVSGVCSPLDPIGEAQEIKERFVKAHPHLKGIAQDPAVRVVAVEVDSLQLLEGPTNSHFQRL